MVVEVVGQQWQWRFRFPGADGQLGAHRRALRQRREPVRPRPDGPQRPGRHPRRRATRCTCRWTSRSRCCSARRTCCTTSTCRRSAHAWTSVPGQVSAFWFTPTQAGPLRGRCAPSSAAWATPTCARIVVVEDEAPFAAWLAGAADLGAGAGEGRAARGRAAAAELVAQGQRAGAGARAASACHSVDGTPGVGPTWKGLFGKTETLVDGPTRQGRRCLPARSRSASRRRRVVQGLPAGDAARSR